MEETGAIVCMKHLSRTIWEESVRDGAGLGLQGGRDDAGAAGTRGDEDAMTAPWMRRLRFTPVTNPFRHWEEVNSHQDRRSGDGHIDL